MQQGALRIASVYGIDIRVHRSWIVIALLVAWSFFSRYVAAEHATVTAVAMALVGALLFFASVLVHELAHSLEARHRGVEVGGITLFLFGGATETASEAERPRDEFALTAVGPFSSLVLAGLFGLIATYAGHTGVGPVAAVAGTLGWINLGLGVFNLLPGAPLDGGRILRSLVWWVTGDRTRAVRVASRAGQMIGYGIAGLGLLQLFTTPGAFLGGLWFVFIGWFLANAAGAELVQQQLRDRLEGRTLLDLVSADRLPALPAAVDLETAADELRRRPESVLALEENGHSVGLVGVEDVAAVPAGERARRQAIEVGRHLDDVPTVPGATPLADALVRMRGEEIVAVTDADGVVLGVVSQEQLQRVLQRASRLDGPARSSRRRPGGHLPRSRRRGRARRGHLPQEERG